MRERVVVGVVGFLLGVIVMQWSNSPGPLADEDDIVTARGFEIRDKNGRVRGTWGFTNDDNVVLGFQDEVEENYFLAMVGNTGNVLTLSGPDGEIVIGVTGAVTGIRINSRDEKTSAMLMVGDAKAFLNLDDGRDERIISP